MEGGSEFLVFFAEGEALASSKRTAFLLQLLVPLVPEDRLEDEYDM